MGLTTRQKRKAIECVEQDVLFYEKQVNVICSVLQKTTGCSQEFVSVFDFKEYQSANAKLFAERKMWPSVEEANEIRLMLLAFFHTLLGELEPLVKAEQSVKRTKLYWCSGESFGYVNCTEVISCRATKQVLICLNNGLPYSFSSLPFSMQHRFNLLGFKSEMLNTNLEPPSLPVSEQPKS